MSQIKFRKVGDLEPERKRIGIHAAIEANNLALVKELIANESDVEQIDRYGETPLGIATDLGCTEIVKVLLEAGAYPEWGSWTTPLQASCYYGYIDIVKLLIKAGADVNLKLENENTALMTAAARGHFEIVQILVENKADVNAVSEHGDFALESAKVNNHQKILNYLAPLTSLELKRKIV